ncbi:MAG TPA: hypothetical protein PLS29_06935 [Acidimicrobiales bacterium]|nr:MAG: hypothetical protein B7Z69_07765 [Actinobacteria bacterium 21-73-9]HQU26752.1 hypothetical protein [Acidimicrobiales bacterium]
MSPTSFDPTRERRVPTRLGGERGALAEITATTLVAVVKPSCDGCHAFTHGDLGPLCDLPVLVVSAAEGDEWADAAREVLVAPEWVEASGVRGAPHYLLVDRSGLVLTEGVLFSPAQVAGEIAAHRR